MEQTNKWQNSECDGGYLHDYRITQVISLGVVERCRLCGDQQFFPHDVPNHIYLSYHIRSALQQDDPRYEHEYQRR